MVTDYADPTNWSLGAATSRVIGLDIGLMQDHSALVAAGAWQAGGRSIMGVIRIEQFPIGAPLDEVADASVEAARSLSARIVYDSSNNSAFGSLLAARIGGNPANSLIAAVLTNALDHAAQPVPTVLSLAGRRCAIPRWTLSKRELIESLAAEIDSGALKVGRVGDFEALRDELTGMERTVRQSGSVSYSAPAGKHDDVVIALALATFGLRRIGASARPRLTRRERPSSLAWT